jgi:hypothetical protein
MHKVNLFLILGLLIYMMSCDEQKQIEEARQKRLFEDSAVLNESKLDSLQNAETQNNFGEISDSINYNGGDEIEYHDDENGDDQEYSSGFVFPLDSSDPILKHGPSMREIETEKWKELSEATDYSVEPKPEKSVQKHDSTDPVFLAGIFNMIKYFSIAVFILLLLWFLFRFIRQSNVNTSIAVQKSEILPIKTETMDFDFLVKDSLEKGAYRESISFALQNLLLALNKSKILIFEAEKTNSDYFIEIKDENIKKGFKALVADFEKYWYGDKELTREQAIAFIEDHYKLIH